MLTTYLTCQVCEKKGENTRSWSGWVGIFRTLWFQVFFRWRGASNWLKALWQDDKGIGWMRYSALVTRVHVSCFLVFVAELLTELVHLYPSALYLPLTSISTQGFGRYLEARLSNHYSCGQGGGGTRGNRKPWAWRDTTWASAVGAWYDELERCAHSAKCDCDYLRWPRLGGNQSVGAWKRRWREAYSTQERRRLFFFFFFFF